MKKYFIVLMFSFLIASVDAATLKGMSLNGSTGLVNIPSGRIGWEKSADVGFDIGYHTIMDNNVTVHIPKVSISLFKLAELGFAYDSQDDPDNADMILNGKIQLPIQGNSAVAVGANAQILKQNGVSSNITQLYLAVTYPGEFFKMPAETTAVIGKRFGDDAPNDAIDFGMGFDLNLFPDTFKGYIHWINDFSNFSYQSQAYYGSDANSRGAFNTGIRIDLASIPELQKYKFAVDAIVTDALDSNRAFCLGIAFGVPVQ